MLLRLYFVLLSLGFAAVLNGCTPLESLDAQHIKIEVSVSEPNRIRFEGKGSGAGMMLMSAVGPMGIAIGIAIDEGIAKEIEAAAKQSDFSIEPLVEKAFTQTWSKQAAVETLNIQVIRYGFRLQPGDFDPVSADIELTISINEKPSITLAYPGDGSNPEAITTEPLDHLKEEGALSTALMETALLDLANRSYLEVL